MILINKQFAEIAVCTAGINKAREQWINFNIRDYMFRKRWLYRELWRRTRWIYTSSGHIFTTHAAFDKEPNFATIITLLVPTWTLGTAVPNTTSTKITHKTPFLKYFILTSNSSGWAGGFITINGRSICLHLNRVYHVQEICFGSLLGKFKCAGFFVRLSKRLCLIF